MPALTSCRDRCAAPKEQEGRVELIAKGDFKGYVKLQIDEIESVTPGPANYLQDQFSIEKIAE